MHLKHICTQVIAAEGEQKASRALREASEVIGDSPAALQLRYLQVRIALLYAFRFIYLLSRIHSIAYIFFLFLKTLNTISAEKNSTIVFPLPIDMLTYFLKAGAGKES